MEYLNTKILNYRLTRFIGEGGMASVYQGTHEKLGTKVAIKILNPVLTANKQIRQRFENEAKMMASLDHPNIVRVLDYDEQFDKLSIIMDLLDGQDLNTLIKAKGAMKPDQAIPLFTQVLDAFSYAHDKGIIHRDIKPSNIFLDSKNGVKILDFGIAKIFQTGENYTLTGTQLGTPTYMSPEQVDADKSIDYRSDIYSLGATLFFMLSGTPPYDSSTLSTFKIYNKIVYEPFPALVSYQDYDEIIQKAVAKDRNQRFPDARAFKNALLNPVPKIKVDVVTPNIETPETDEPKPEPDLVDDDKTLPDTSNKQDKGQKTIPLNKDKQKEDTPKSSGSSPKSTPYDDDDKTWVDSPGAKPAMPKSKQDKDRRNDRPEIQKEPEKEHKKLNFDERIKQADLLFNHNEFTRAKIAYENALTYRTDDEYIKARIERCKSELTWRKNRNIFIIATSVVIVLLAIYLTIREFDKPNNNLSAQISEFEFDYPTVYVPGGTFQMGSNDGENDEKPVHKVTISGFNIGKYEVTQANWREIIGDKTSLGTPSYFKDCDDCPIEKVSWNDVQEFIKKLNSITGKKYRLPTEAEWEYAARGGSDSINLKFSGSDNIEEVAWYNKNSGNKTKPVGQKNPNKFGLYDMSGNVWEWCSDTYRSYNKDDSVNPEGNNSGSNRVIRSGSWYNDPFQCRVFERRYGDQDYKSSIIGFRLVLVS